MRRIDEMGRKRTKGHGVTQIALRDVTDLLAVSCQRFLFMFLDSFGSLWFSNFWCHLVWLLFVISCNVASTHLILSCNALSYLVLSHLVMYLTHHVTKSIRLLNKNIIAKGLKEK
jgi:hypothetical protein